ncbi:MAG TPA: LD-carboxypeptidase [Candidatus Acidoferrales bacterium]|nr:LD-carboxypeptidase [Candidatus Acidoferrales bacterium]
MNSSDAVTFCHLDSPAKFSYPRLRHMPTAVKPPALEPGDTVRIIAPASPVEEAVLRNGCAEIERLGFVPKWDPRVLARQGYFAGSAEERVSKFQAAFEDGDSTAIVCARGGYGAGYLLEQIEPRRLKSPKALIGYSDITLLQLYLWRKKRWVSIYGPMVAAGLDVGADVATGYDSESFHQALTQTSHGWTLDLRGETLLFGRAEGTIIGGCLTLVEATLGTPWEIQTGGTILLLEDRATKPYQVDRALIHLRQAGKLKGVRGMVLGEFPDSEPPVGSATVREVFERIVGPLEIPVVWGAPVGHTPRAMLTVPLGVRARLIAQGSGRLEILEPACSGALGPARTRQTNRGKPSKRV